MLKIAHIINPYQAPAGSEHAIAQPITMRSMLAAKQNSDDNTEIELYAAILKGDEAIVPEGFKIVHLKRSLTDVANFKGARPLPLIADILDLLKESAADYFIYSNIDIALQPHFYDSVSSYISNGHDALIINRRGIPSHFKSIEQLPAMYLEEGKEHPGFDCFVFKRELKPSFIFNNICIGIPRFERVFALNIFCFATQPLLLDKERLTFHIGEDILKNWGDKAHWRHNETEYQIIRKELFKQLRITKFPYWNDNIIKRYWKWLWNPNFSLPDNLRLEWRYRLRGF